MPGSRPASGRIRQARTGRQADRRGVDQQLRARARVSRALVVQRDAQLACQRNGSLRRPVPDGDLGPGLAQRPDHRARRAAGTQHQRPRGPRPARPARRAAHRASVLSAAMRPSSKLSVLAAPIAAAVVAQLVRQLEGGQLVGNRHVRAHVARAGQRAHGLGESVPAASAARR